MTSGCWRRDKAKRILAGVLVGIVLVVFIFSEPNWWGLSTNRGEVFARSCRYHLVRSVAASKTGSIS